MEFTYANDVPTIESAIAQGIGLGSTCWSNVSEAGTFDTDLARAAVAVTVNEVRNILAAELSVLLDRDGVAFDWNAAIDAAIQLVEGKL